MPSAYIRWKGILSCADSFFLSPCRFAFAIAASIAFLSARVSFLDNLFYLLVKFFLPFQHGIEIVRFIRPSFGAQEVDPENVAEDLLQRQPRHPAAPLGEAPACRAAAVIRGDVKNVHTVRTGIEYMTWLADYYSKTTVDAPLGMFQIGGGISGDFPICVVPMLHQDLRRDAALWGYFCQISDSTTSYGSYSGAVPNEKITCGVSPTRKNAAEPALTSRTIAPAQLQRAGTNRTAQKQLTRRGGHHPLDPTAPSTYRFGG